MNQFKNFFLRALLALSILAAAPAALAGPIYRVTLDTGAWSGQSGYLDLSFGGLAGAGASSASAANFAGDFDASSDPYFESLASGSRLGGFTLVAGDALALVSQAVTFGGVFSFDLRFDAADSGLASDFGVYLLDQDFNPKTERFAALSFTVFPGGEVGIEGEELARVDIVNAVPEPADWLLVVTGLALMGALRGAQRRR